MDAQPIEVWVDEDIAELLPGYLERRGEDVSSIGEALDQGDFGRIRVLGHSMKGSGGGYGLGKVSVIGRQLEEGAALEDVERIRVSRYQLQHYLSHLVIHIKPAAR